MNVEILENTLIHGKSSNKGTTVTNLLDSTTEENNTLHHNEKIINTSKLDSNNNSSSNDTLDSLSRTIVQHETISNSRSDAVTQSSMDDSIKPTNTASSTDTDTICDLGIMNVTVLIPRPSITDRYGFTSTDRYI